MAGVFPARLKYSPRLMGARDVLIPNLDCLSAEFWRLGGKRQCPPPPRAHPACSASATGGHRGGGLASGFQPRQPWGHLCGQLGTTQPLRGTAPSPAFRAGKSTSKVGRGLGSSKESGASPAGSAVALGQSFTVKERTTGNNNRRNGWRGTREGVTRPVSPVPPPPHPSRAPSTSETTWGGASLLSL